MLVRSSKFILHMLAASLLGLVFVCGFAVWQLSRGPISVGFLTPYVEDALNAEVAPVRVRLGNTVLAWAGFDRTLDVRAVGLDVLGDDGAVRVSVPEISVRFSARALLNGLIAPTSLELLGPRIRVVRNPEGALALDMASEGPATEATNLDIAKILDELVARPDRTRETGYLTRIAVSSALIEYEDMKSGIRVTAPRVNLALERDRDGVRAAGSVAVDFAGKQARFQVSGILSARSGNSELGLTFTDLKPGTLARLTPALAFLDDVDIPFNGTIALSLDRHFVIDDVGFDIDSAGGAISLPALYPDARRIAGISVRGRARDDFTSFAVDEGKFRIGGAQVALSGTVVRRGHRLIAGFDAGIRDVASNDIETWWPESINPKARSWVTKNLRDGTVESAHVNINGTAPVDQPTAFEITGVDGRIDATGVTVHYLRPMEPVHNANAVSTFDLNGFVINATAGELRQMNVDSGRITISGLNGDPGGERINIDLIFSGSARGALELLDQEPLGFIRRLDVDPSRASGQHRTQLIVQLPLIADLEVEDIVVAAASNLTGFGLEKGPLGLPVSNADLSLQVDKEKMIVDGNLSISGVSAGIAWTEWFADDIPTRRTYQVRAILNDAARTKLGFELAPWVTGPIGIGLSYSEAGIGVVSGAAELDLSSAAMAVDDIGWRKTAGIPGRAFVRFSGDRDHIRRLDRFSIAAADLIAEGEIGLRQDDVGGMTPARVTLNRLAFGGTDIFAAAEIAETGAVDVSIGGRQLDLRQQVAAFGDGESDVANEQARPIRVHVSQRAPIGTVRLGEATVLNNLKGTIRTRGPDLREAEIEADLNGKGAVSLGIVDKGSTRDLQLVAVNGGDLVSSLDVTDTILGGRLELLGAIDDAVKPTTFNGQVTLTDFHLSEASSIARALTLASFSGISEGVGGRGLAFRRAEVPLTYSRDEVVLTEAKLRGSDIGVLATGRIDRRAGTIKLDGEIAPAYTLNSLLGNIPLIGTILTGGGDGIFAASYAVRGPIEQPVVTVNPLTVLTPGIIRRLLTGFGSDNKVGDPTFPGNDPAGPNAGQAPAQ